MAVLRGHLDVTKWDLASDLNTSMVNNISHDDDDDDDNDDDNKDFRKGTDKEANLDSKKQMMNNGKKINVLKNKNKNKNRNKNENRNENENENEGNRENNNEEVERKRNKKFDIEEEEVDVKATENKNQNEKENENKNENKNKNENESEGSINLIWQKEAMKISLETHYKLFLELVEREKHGIFLVKEKEEKKREEERDQEKEKEKEIGIELERDESKDKKETYGICKEENGNDKIKLIKKKKNNIRYIKNENDGFTFLEPSTLPEQLYFLLKHDKNSFEKHPKLRKLLRKALKV